MSETTLRAPLKVNDCWNRIGVRGDGSCVELKQHVHCRNCSVYGAAAAQFLNHSAPAGYIAEWTRHAAQKKEENKSQLLSLFIFRIGREWLALTTRTLREVASLSPIHSLPNRHNGAVLGLVNVRGELLICFSLGVILGIDLSAGNSRKNRTLHEMRRLLVIENEEDHGRIAFPVEEAHGIVHRTAGELTKIPATLSAASATYTHALLPWGERTVGCLDERLLFGALTRSLG